MSRRIWLEISHLKKQIYYLNRNYKIPSASDDM